MEHFSRTKKNFLLVSVALGLVLAACGGGNDSAPATPAPVPAPAPAPAEDGPVEIFADLVIGTGSDAAYANFLVAVDLGLFEKHGIDAKLEIFPSGAESLEAVITGLADSSGNGQYNFPFMAARGADVKAIAQYARSDRQFAAVGVGINGPQDLVGKRVGTQLGTSPEYYYRLYLEKYGVDPASVELVNIQFAQLVPALLNKDIDAYFAFGPHIVRGLETIPDASVFHYSGDDSVMPLRVYAGVGPKVSGDPRVAEAYVKALIEAGEILTENPEIGAELMLEYFDIELERGREMLQNFDYGVSFSADSFAELVSVSKFVFEAGVVPNPVDANGIAYLDAMRSVAPELTR